ncbi:MAG: DUF1924 domain-containing protein [Burkholderiaceae bacterium]
MNRVMHRWMRVLWVSALAGLASAAMAGDTSPEAQLRRWEAAAGSAGDAGRGQQFFTERHGREWACASCHHAPPTTEGRHQSTGKRIDPLAPAINPDALTSERRADKWFRRNCRDVLDRECSAQEKADVIAWLIGLR